VSFTAKWNPAIEKITAKAAAQGLTLGMMVIQSKSMANTPVDTGNLKASQTVIPATMDGLTATLSTDVPYAIYVHEILTNNHPVGKAKFMEDAVSSEGDRAVALLAATIAKAL
jgi:hypothetical protein